MPHASNKLGGHGCFGTWNSKYGSKGCVTSDESEIASYQQVAINEQSCLFLEILLFIMIFLPNKWHERIRVGKEHQPCANHQPVERLF
jgi:hypothetical protein